MLWHPSAIIEGRAGYLGAAFQYCLPIKMLDNPVVSKLYQVLMAMTP